MRKAVGLMELFDRYRTEEDCVRRLYELKTEGGWECPRCGSHAHALLLFRRKIQCTCCSHQQAVTADTPMHRSHIPLRKWFLAISLIAEDKRGVSAVRLSRELGVKWESAYYLLQRVRGAMAGRCAGAALAGKLEVDDAYLGASGKGLCGRGTNRAPFIAAVERRVGGGCSMRAVADCSGGSYLEFGSYHLNRTAHVRADDWNGCKGGLRDWPGLDQRKYVEGDPDAGLPAVHHIISNFKAFVLGTFHGVTTAYLQGYMDEFCWRYGHRGRKGGFTPLLEELCSSPKETKAQLKERFAPQPPQPKMLRRSQWAASKTKACA